ncbi:MAG: 4Fe-4S dicluster domain-containing protein [Candidatus Bathyarchaeia archaeon]
MKRLLVRAESCAGCRFCEMVCSFSHEGRFSPSLSRITVIKEDRFGFDYPIFCRLCESCPPADSCPSRALGRSPEGTLMLDEEACSGCGTCLKACPHTALKIGEASKPIFCDLCGGRPRCVERCPTGALSYEEVEEFDEKPIEALKRLMERWGLHA